MNQEYTIKGFVQLGKLMLALGKDEEWKDFSIGVTQDEYLQLNTIINRQVSHNGWFTKENVRKSLKALGEWLTEDSLTEWSKQYAFTSTPKKVGLIMAGNIPLVGFHDFLCVIISGNTAVCKLSSDDKTLLPALAAHLVEFAPELKERIVFSAGKIGELDAVIATGSDNSLKYFEEYFGKYPHIFRKNRSSVAILTGNEPKEELEQLGEDIFAYFGLGCRNVSHLLLPEGFEMPRFFEGVYSHHEVIHNNKYGNNYDYNKTVYLMNQLPLLDNNFMLLRESEELFSPLAMVHYQYYSTQEEIDQFLEQNKDNLQAIVGQNYIPFGQAQCPNLDDYADGVNVMAWLTEIS
ncbi:MAG: acyl-CoA reductase [Crocinitomicaceae bacterium]|nr:acyl-CoA reductase [Crocinitomicaceae bacterium]